MAVEKAQPPPPGIYVPVPTFFVSRKASNYSPVAPPLDLETQAKHALHLAKSGIRGLVILGSTGEAVAITSRERSQLLQHVRGELDKANFKDYPIVAGTYTQGIEDTIQQLQISKDAGAQYGLVLAPGYFATALNQEGIKDWYNAIAERSPIPIMVYVSLFLLGPYATAATSRSRHTFAWPRSRCIALEANQLTKFKLSLPRGVK